MKKNLTYIVLSICLGIAAVQAKELPFNLPPELMTKYGVIAPLCFERFTAEDAKTQSLNLKTSACLKHKQQYNQYALNKGFLGYDLPTQDHVMRQPAILYRYVGKLVNNSQQRYIFEINWSGGGTGFFSMVVAMKLNDNILSLDKSYNGGDRCNGGITQASIKNNQVHYQANTTPYDLLNLSFNQNNKEKEINAATCAVCCIGHLYYSNNKITGFKFNQFTPFANDNEPQQQCIDNLLIKFGAKEKRFLTPKEITELQNQVRQSCL